MQYIDLLKDFFINNLLLLDESYLVQTVNYLLYTMDEVKISLFISQLAEKLPRPLSEYTMNAAERLIQQGVQQGMQQGEYAMLLRLLQRKFHRVPQVYLENLVKADADTLLKWGERVLEASSLEEVFKS